MEQQQARSLVAPTLLRHARRAVVVLVGAGVWWLVFLSGGAAHADDHVVPGHASLHQAGAVADHVDRTGRTITSTLSTTPSRVSGTARSSMRHAPAPVVRTVESVTAGLEPSLTLTTATLADAVDSSVSTTETVLATALRSAGDAGPSTGPSTGTTPRPPHPRTAVPATGVVPQPGPSAVTDQVASPAPSASGPAVPPTQRNGSAPAAPVLPGNSAAGGPACAASFGGLALLLPALRRLGRDRDEAGLPSGPAYRPGSSPD